MMKRNIIQTNVKALITNIQDAMKIMQYIIMSIQEKSKKASEKQRSNDKLLHTLMNNTPTIIRNKNNIAILQYNLNKNKTTTYSILNHSNITCFTILALQE